MDPRPRPLTSPHPIPLVAAASMGYGHLRAARPLAGFFSTELARVDRPPLARGGEERLWDGVRGAYELSTRLSQVPLVGGPLRRAVAALTDIPPLEPERDRSAPTRGARALDALVRHGLGRGLVEELRRSGRALLTTFYAPAVAADAAGLDGIFCVVTDTDVNRVWAPLQADRTRIRYLAPAPRVVRRLRQYGVPEARITLTGFPLPHDLLGGPGLPALRRNLAARLVRLDPAGAFRRARAAELEGLGVPLPSAEEGRPPLLAFAVGGAGAQAALARRFLPSLRREVEEGRWRVALVAGVRPAVERAFREAVRRSGLERQLGSGVEILHHPDLDGYLAAMDALLARADVLWSKPSELCFYAALGLPFVCAPPIGVHEEMNRRWLAEAGAGIDQGEPGAAAGWLAELLRSGALAEAAWAGHLRLPADGLYRIADALLRLA